MMKSLRFLTMAIMALTLIFTSCGTQKKAVKENVVESTDTLGQHDFLRLVHSTMNNNKMMFVTSKVKFTVEVGPQRLRLTGNLQMKRDDVIRLQLMAFGFVEAGRMEFTKDYVLIMDRINKQYLKVPYQYVDFLRNSGINFYTLQALFWNELYIPGKDNVNEKSLDNFTTELGGDEAVIYLERNRVNYSWLANEKTGRIKMANIMYRDSYGENTQLNWNYEEYSPLNGKLFPSEMIATLTTPKKEVKMEMKLSYLRNEAEWDPRTTVPEKYREVEVDAILERIMAL